MQQILLAISTLLFLASIGYTAFALGAARHLPHRFNFWMLAAGFAAQSSFLYLRGLEIGRCPLTNLFEVLLFLSWATVLLYLIVGPAFHLSLMGAFAAPLALLLQILALLVGDRQPSTPPAVLNPWIETHAALSVISFGAFGLAAVAGAMFLLQDTMLKTRRIQPLFYKLPPIGELAKTILRLMIVGVILLGVGIVAGFAVGYLPEKSKLLAALAAWCLYAGLLLARALRPLSARKMAVASVAAFALSLGGFLWIAKVAVH